MLFSGNIEDNIAYGWRPENGSLKFQDVLNAARQANALEFIESFPQGFSTVVGEKGQSLSGRSAVVMVYCDVVWFCVVWCGTM
jgi:ABC-type multidrug transport system fused ATPase/permease subunit